jgi:hypothetical protein
VCVCERERERERESKHTKGCCDLFSSICALRANYLDRVVELDIPFYK